MIKEYIAYLKDNPEGYWFKAKLYGWGWDPAKWQGWLVLILFVVFLAWSAFGLPSEGVPSNAQLAWFFVKTVFAVFVIIATCYKTGERPSWHWGVPEKYKK